MFLRVSALVWPLFREALRALSPDRAVLDDIASGLRPRQEFSRRARPRRVVAKMRDWRGRLWLLHPTKGWRLG